MLLISLLSGAERIHPRLSLIIAGRENCAGWLPRLETSLRFMREEDDTFLEPLASDFRGGNTRRTCDHIILLTRSDNRLL
jgi:hypothetical protein